MRERHLALTQIIINAERRRIMLPEIRQNDFLFSVPKFDIDKNDVDGFLNELVGFHENFGSVVNRRPEKKSPSYVFLIALGMSNFPLCSEESHKLEKND